MKYKLNQILWDDCMNVMADIPDKYFELAIVLMLDFQLYIYTMSL